jgi:protein TonB
MEPTFSRSMLVWPLAGTGMVVPEADGPSLVIPHGALQISLRDSAGQGLTADIGAEPLAAEPDGTAALQVGKSLRKWPITVVASCVLHAAAAMALLASGLFSAPSDLQQLEGADQPGVMLVGNAADDQSMAGEITNITLVVMPEPVEIVQEQPAVEEAPLPVEQAASEPPVTETPTPKPQPVQEPLHEPVATEDVQPEEPAPEAATNPFPEILSVVPQVLDDAGDAVQKAVQADVVEAAQKAEAAKAETVETAPTPKAVESKPVKPKNPVAKAKPVEQAKPEPKPEKSEPKPAKPVRKKTSSGAGGANQADAKRGVANGVTKGQSTTASKGGAKSAIGNAAVSNYPGKVAAKLRRVSRSLSRSAQSGARNNAQVSFVVTSSGGVDALRLVKSSGSPELDKAALAIIRRAAPFPPIPAEAQRSSWAFALPIGPF